MHRSRDWSRELCHVTLERQAENRDNVQTGPVTPFSFRVEHSALHAGVVCSREEDKLFLKSSSPTKPNGIVQCSFCSRTFNHFLMLARQSALGTEAGGGGGGVDDSPLASWALVDVNGGGEEEADGSAQRPFSTVQLCAEHVRRRQGLRGCILRSGVYRESVVVESMDRGTFTDVQIVSWRTSHNEWNCQTAWQCVDSVQGRHLSDELGAQLHTAVQGAVSAAFRERCVHE